MMSIKNETNINTFFIVDGAQNSFLIHPYLISEEELTRTNISNLAKKLCTKDPYLKIDGMIFLVSAASADYDFRWEFFNSDGSSAEMCGNAARCVARVYFENIDLNKESIKFLTKAGIIAAEKLENKISIKMTKPTILKQEKSIELDGQNIKGLYLDTGVPHFVVEDRLNINQSRQLRQHLEFSPRGANITQIKKISANRAKAVTYERGVEDFTRACGTGAVATAVYLSLHSNDKIYYIEMPGGELVVDLKNISEPRLIGYANIIAKIDFIED